MIGILSINLQRNVKEFSVSGPTCKELGGIHPHSKKKSLTNWKPTTLLRSTREMRPQGKLPPWKWERQTDSYRESQLTRRSQFTRNKSQKLKSTSQLESTNISRNIFNCKWGTAGGSSAPAWELKTAKEAQPSRGPTTFLNFNSKSLRDYQCEDWRKISCFLHG